MSDNREDITYRMTFLKNFMTAYSSFITGQITDENLQAITSVELLIVPKIILVIYK